VVVSTASPSNSAPQASVIPLVTVPVSVSATPQTINIPSTVVLVLSDRALGAPIDSNPGARAFLRETNNPATQPAGADSSAPPLISSSVFLSASAQATTSGEQERLVVEAG